MNSLVSIILPTYNVEKYLRKCLESVISQTYKNIEIIIVIDGSTDNSLIIAKEFEKKDNRIVVIQQNNSGSGPARNNGLDNAHGEYIIFIDPDDWVDNNLVETLLNAQEKKYDFVLSDSTTVVFESDLEIRREIHIPEPKDYSMEEMRNNYLRLFKDGLIGSPTKKLYLKTIIDKYDIRFPALRRSQDIVFNYRYFDKCKNLRVIAYAGYYYRVEPRDRIKRINPDYYNTTNQIISEVADLMNEWKVTVSKEDFYNTYLYMYIANLESCAISNIDMSDIVKNPNVKEAFRNASCDRFDKKIMKYCVLNEKKRLLSRFLKMRFQIKRIKHMK